MQNGRVPKAGRAWAHLVTTAAEPELGSPHRSPPPPPRGVPAQVVRARQNTCSARRRTPLMPCSRCQASYPEHGLRTRHHQQAARLLALALAGSAAGQGWAALFKPRHALAAGAYFGRIGGRSSPPQARCCRESCGPGCAAPSGAHPQSCSVSLPSCRSLLSPAPPTLANSVAG